MSMARKKAMRIFAAMTKRAQDDEYPELSGRSGSRGVGQRFFEGGMHGAGTGLTLGTVLGALAGGYGGYRQSQGRDTKDMLKAILTNALAGAGVGAGMGATAGGVLGAGGSTLFGSRRQQPTY